MLLRDRTAVVYGAGSIGGAVAQGFAREGARVFLASRSEPGLTRVADAIRAEGGAVETAVLDALDAGQVDAHADAVAAAAGGIDVSSNLITHGDVQGTPMADMALEDYVRPVVTAVTTTFLTARAAARHMRRRGGGVILIFGGSGDPVRGYSLGGLQVAFDALESMRRQLASELGPEGIRTVTLRSGGVPDSLPGDDPALGPIAEGITAATMLGRAATLEDVGHAAAFAASDRARAMTAATINISAGALID